MHSRALEAVCAQKLRIVEGYVEIPSDLFVEKIDVNMNPVPPLALYTQTDDRKFKLLKPVDQPYSPLVLSLHDFLWINESDLPSLQRYAEARVLSPNSHMPMGDRMEILRRTAMAIVDETFQNPTPENVQRCKRVVSQFVYVLMREPQAFMLLQRLASHDPYTLQHSVGTAVNCVALGRRMGFTKPQDLDDIGLSGLLHDIGKTKVKPSIINKEGPLDDVEWEEMRQHAEEGFEIVRSIQGISERTKRAILEHHEDRNGTGYPRGLKQTEIDVFSKIVCLCDVFNALTTERSYSKARTPYEALTFIREKLPHKIDETVYSHLVLIYGGKF